MRFLLITTLGLASSSLAQTVVYEDNFDGDGIGTNTGVGGGATAYRLRSTTAFEWNDDDPASAGLEAGSTTVGNHITTFETNNSFILSDGFTLEVVFNVTNIGTTPTNANHLAFGLTTVTQENINDTNFLSNTTADDLADIIGFSFGIRNNNVDSGILENDVDGDGGSPLYSVLSAITFDPGVDQTLTLDVAANGSFTYSYINTAATEVTGSGTTLIDLTKPYYFRARTQGSQGNAIQSISLSTNTAQFIAPTIETANTVCDLNATTDFAITFDPTADTAVLTTPSGGSEDLKALDASDAIPNDGIVLYQEAVSPLGLGEYEVTATRAGSVDLSASVEILIIDPADEAADNALSLAIKGDSPLFYYRFEEASDSTFVRDSSGNRHHTDDFTANLLNVAFGNGPAPGGVGNAVDFRPVGGARAIQVPVTSEMSESFTFTSLVNISATGVANPRSLLSMSNGTGTGAIILNKQNANTIFRSNLDGTVDNLSAADEFPLETTCMLHYVFTADDVNGGGSHVLYVNGVEAAAAVTVAPFGPNEGNWVIGANQILGDPSWFDWIDEAAIFEEALTVGQIETQVDAFFAAADPLLGFSASSPEITVGDSVDLMWKTSDSATAVTINGDPVDGAAGGGIYSSSFSPTETTSYEIEVTGPGGPFLATVEVTVVAPPGPIVITGCSLDDSDPPQITIDFIGTANTPYEVHFSSDLIFTGTDIASEPTTDANGIGTTTFATFGDSEFYRIQLPE